MKRIVLDTSVLVGAFLVYGGVARKMLRTVQTERCRLVLCNDILIETARALLTYTRIKRRYIYTDDDVHRYLRGIEAISDNVRPFHLTVSRDPNDDIVVGCALAGGADTIVTRDMDLLILKSHNDIEVVDPERYLKALRHSQSLAVRPIRKKRS